MKLTSLLGVAFLFTALQLDSVARADDRHEDHHEERHEERHYAPRPEPPRFQPHAQGIHPHGAMVRSHAIRVLSPKVIKYGGHEWRHWEHPEFARPVYYWDWGAVHHITCIAEDSYGDQYPVTEATFPGFRLANMSAVEDDALDRCNAESGGDASCYLASCSHF